jgi:hypothetical protein
VQGKQKWQKRGGVGGGEKVKKSGEKNQFISHWQSLMSRLNDKS